MNIRRAMILAATSVALSCAVIGVAQRLGNAQQTAMPHHPDKSTADSTVVTLCDGRTSVAIKGVAPGTTLSHDQAVAVSSQLMSDWRRQHPDQPWEMAQAESPKKNDQPPTPASAGNQPSSKGAIKLQQGDTYASFHERDYQVWQNETQKFIEEGNRIFHSAQLLGGTIGISCDMCHPDGANTHPETYPKYQVQLQRVALLRDMIDWCIENPVKGKALDPNDERLRALEAYIIAQRKGVPLDYGKH